MKRVFYGGNNMWYRAEFEDENFEMILADNDNEAFESAREMEEEPVTRGYKK